jgi:histidine triad (HIT) family protein
MESHCIFCRIARRESPAEIIYETDRVLAMLDIRPIHYGHALIIPKLHCPDLLAVPKDHLQDLIVGTQVVAGALVSSLGLKGFNTFSNNGEIAGQSVFHFHMHVTPRYASDNIRFVLSLKEYSDGDMHAMGEQIRSAIRAEGPHRRTGT